MNEQPTERFPRLANLAYETGNDIIALIERRLAHVRMVANAHLADGRGDKAEECTLDIAALESAKELLEFRDRGNHALREREKSH